MVISIVIFKNIAGQRLFIGGKVSINQYTIQNDGVHTCNGLCLNDRYGKYLNLNGFRKLTKFDYFGKYANVTKNLQICKFGVF